MALFALIIQLDNRWPHNIFSLLHARLTALYLISIFRILPHFYPSKILLV